MLLLLEHHELTVSELCSVMQLPQSTVSRHLKTLADAAWVSSRRDGTSRYYTLALDARTAPTRRLWAVLRDQVGSSVGADQDARRLKGVLARRQSTSEEFFASSAGQWDRLRQDLFGPRSLLHALPALFDARWVIGDLGCGTGQTSEAVAPFVASVVAVDRSGEMLQAARRRLARSTQRGHPSRRARGAADRRRGARRRDHDARAAPRAGSAGGAPRNRARAAPRRPARCSATCCRTIARSTSSRWATSGSGLPKSSSAGC